MLALAPVLALSTPTDTGPVLWALATADAEALHLLLTEDGSVGLYPDWMMATVGLYMLGGLMNDGETIVPVREGFAATVGQVRHLPAETSMRTADATIAVADHVNSVIRRWARERLPRT